MTKLVNKISNMPNTYDDFVLGVINYAKRNNEHVKILNDFLDKHPEATTSDVIEFIIQQPDFRSYSATNIAKRVG